MKTYRFGDVSVRVFPETRYLETVFADGTKVPAAPEDTDAYRAQAQSLGYGDDVWRMCMEHEIAHTLIAQRLGQPHSGSLWAVAHGSPTHTDKPGEMWSEEEMVMAFQRWANFTGLNWLPADPESE